MSDTFVVAARLRLKKKAVTAWLRDKPSEPASIVGWDNLFDEHDAGRMLPIANPTARSVRHVFAGFADEVAANEAAGLVASWSGSKRSFLFYHVMIGWQPDTVAASLGALATAARHWTAKKPTTALVFAETSGQLSAPGTLATLAIGQGQAGVATSVDLDTLVDDLMPAQQAWQDALESGLIDALHNPAILQPAIRQLAKSPLLAKRRLDVPTFDTADAWLSAIGEITLQTGATPTVSCYGSFGRFERDIMAWASQASRFGVACHEALLALIESGPWEAAVVALWACNVLARSTGNGRLYLSAIDRLRAAPHGHLGWARGELTDGHIQARREHRAALADTPMAGWTYHRLMTKKWSLPD